MYQASDNAEENVQAATKKAWRAPHFIVATLQDDTQKPMGTSDVFLAPSDPGYGVS